MGSRLTGWRFRWVALGSVLLLGFGAWRALARPTVEMQSRGKALFEYAWQPHDPRAGGGDGLGPVFNAQSCVACHFQGGVGGSGTNASNVLAFEVVPTPERPHVHSGVVHGLATQPHLLESRSAVHHIFPIVRGGVRLIGGCQVRVADFDPVIFHNVSTPALFGAGLIDRISHLSLRVPAAKRTAAAISKEMGGDFSSIPVGRKRGKFGWKGQFDSLADFVAAACAVELGLSNPGRRQDLPGRHEEDHSAALDISGRQLRELVAFVAALPRPREVLPAWPADREHAARGKQVFSDVGCAECHTPNVGGVEGIYSDFLLYRLDDEGQFGYQRVETEFEMPRGHPRPGDWKTPPLWGVADSAPYFHDGGSPTLEAAIMRHGGDARASRSKFEALRGRDRSALLAFLQTLRAPAADGMLEAESAIASR